MTALPEGEHEMNRAVIVTNVNQYNYVETNTTYEAGTTHGEAEENNIDDPQLLDFLKKNDLMDMQEQIASSKLTLSHFQGVERSDLEDLCTDLHLSSSQKIRLKHAINSLKFQKKIVRKRIRNKMKSNALNPKHKNMLRKKRSDNKQNLVRVANNSNKSNNNKPVPLSKSNHANDSVHRLSSKIVIVGEAAVGKTTLQKAMLGYAFEEGSKATCAVTSAHHKSQYKFKNMNMRIDYEIFDTPGLDRFCDIITLYLRGALAVIVVYDVCDQASFVKAQWWIDYLENNASGYDKIILIANKIDIIEDRSDDEDDDIIKEGRFYATEHGIAFLEVSAKNRANVNVLLSWVDKQSKKSVAKNPHVIQKNATLIKLHEPLLRNNGRRNEAFLQRFDLNHARCCALN